MAVKASERVKRYQNPNGPTISTVERKVIEQDGLYFKDIDGTGTVSAVNDWRLTPAERAEAYVKVLTTSEKIGQIFTSDWRMGPKYPSPRLAANGHKPVADESGLLDEGRIRKGQTFLDLGTGSGVLSVGLCKSGLSGEGYDIDPIAVDNAVENRALNHISAADYTVGLGSIEKTEGRTFDVVVANILAGPLMEMAPALAAARKKDGVLILSGILTVQADDVEAAYMKTGLPESERLHDGEWACLIWK